MPKETPSTANSNPLEDHEFLLKIKGCDGGKSQRVKALIKDILTMFKQRVESHFRGKTMGIQGFWYRICGGLAAMCNFLLGTAKWKKLMADLKDVKGVEGKWWYLKHKPAD